MGLIMTAIHAQIEPYSSLDALCRANDELIASLPPEDTYSGEADQLAAEERTIRFISRAVETGAVLDTLADRKVAQATIDYWIASAYTAPGVSGAEFS